MDKVATTLQSGPVAPEVESRVGAHAPGEPGSTVLIVNAKARNGEEWFARSQEALKAKGVRVDAAHDLQDPTRLSKLVKTAIGQGVKRLIVGGGDGTFRSIAGLLVHTDVTLGVLPLGTVNDLARNLGIEADVDKACAVIADGNTD